MFRWENKTSAEWLKARKDVLTATDVRNLLTTVRKYNRSKKIYERKDSAFKKMQEGDYDARWIGVYGEKCSICEPDVFSNGAAGRGHELEPYAIAQFNADSVGAQTFYHWDDCLIKNATMELGYSPDAMSMEQPNNCPVVIDVDKDTEPYQVLEIKSYSASHHMQCVCCDDKSNLDERWQIACAMATDYAIDAGYVYFFNPSVEIYGESFKFERKELQGEIELIWDMASAFSHLRELMPTNAPGKLLMDEDDIIGDIISKRNKEARKLENLIKESVV